MPGPSSLGVGATSDQARQCDSLVLRRALIAADGFGIALDLRVHGVAEPEPLVTQLVHEFRVEHWQRGAILGAGPEAELRAALRFHPAADGNVVLLVVNLCFAGTERIGQKIAIDGQPDSRNNWANPFFRDEKI